MFYPFRARHVCFSFPARFVNSQAPHGLSKMAALFAVIFRSRTYLDFWETDYNVLWQWPARAKYMLFGYYSYQEWVILQLTTVVKSTVLYQKVFSLISVCLTGRSMVYRASLANQFCYCDFRQIEDTHTYTPTHFNFVCHSIDWWRRWCLILNWLILII